MLMSRFPLVVLLLCAISCGESGGSGLAGPDGGTADGTTADVSDLDVAPPPSDVPADTAEPMDIAPALTDTEEADTTPPPPVIPPPTVEPLFANCSPPGGSRNIYDIQDPQCPDHISPEPIGSPGVNIALANVIVTAVFGDTFFVQEENGGPYSGIAIYSHGLNTSELQLGDRVDVTGNYSEYFDNSQVHLETWSVISSGAIPEAYGIDHPAHIATNGPISELFEGVLVRVSDVSTIHTKPDCPHDYGEFMVTSQLRIDNMGVVWDARLGDVFSSITGPLHYTFGEFKLEPRFDADLAWTEKGGTSALSKCVAGDCHELPETLGSQQVIINEIMADPYGEDTGQEWFELYNPTDQPVSIDGWQVRDCAAQELTIVGANLIVAPKGYLVIGQNSNTTTNGGVPVDYAYGNAFFLANTIGSILLYDSALPTAVLVDQTRFSRFEPWDVLQVGASIERISPTHNGTQPTSWKTATQTFGSTENKGTPGKKNTASP